MKLSKKKTRILVSVSVFFALTAASPFIINLYVKSSVAKRIKPMSDVSDIRPDCIIVFGAGLQPDNTPSPMLTDRLLRAIELYQAGVSGRLLMSGDHGQTNYDEVNAMKRFAVDRQIPSENIFMDHAGFSTYESIYRARDVFKVKKAILVTQEYHLYRALYIARSLGIEAYGVSSDLQSYAGQSKYEAREVLARVKDFGMSVFKPKPGFLGEAIPVSGNGDLTNDISEY